MLKFLYVTRISNFSIFLAYLNSDFKQVVISYLDELLALQCMVKKLQMSSF
jgi:hypothetical protein